MRRRALCGAFRVRQTRRRPARRRLRRLALAAAVPAVAAATALAMSVSYSSDRRLASQYRAALQGALEVRPDTALAEELRYDRLAGPLG